VYLTSGDAGLGITYATGREMGSKAAYSLMVSTEATQSSDNTWATSTGFLGNQHVVIESYSGNPNVQHVRLRIPDGNYLGDGFPATNSMSLRKLYAGQIKAIQTLPIDIPPTSPNRLNTMGVSYSCYTLDRLKKAISEVVALTKPVVVRTQDWQGEGRSDHSDHYTTAKIVQEAVGSKGIDIVG